MQHEKKSPWYWIMVGIGIAAVIQTALRLARGEL